MSFACLFPGQGAQRVGMLADLAEAYPRVSETFAEASEVLNEDLWQLASQGPEEQLNQTHNTQPALLAAGISVWRVWCEQGGGRPQYFAGHSLGEYTALVAAGVLTFEDAVALVRRRGELMQEAVAPGVGGMAAVLGLDDEAVREICASLSTAEDIVEAVNFNAPGQVVLSGHVTAVEKAVEVCREKGARRAVVLDVSVPSHSSLMLSAAERFKQTLEKTSFAAPEVAVINNVDVQIETDSDRIRDALFRQLCAPVRWFDGILKMIEKNVDTLVELGPGRVLTGLNRRIAKGASAWSVETPETLEQALEATADGE